MNNFKTETIADVQLNAQNRIKLLNKTTKTDISNIYYNYGWLQK